MGTWLVYSMNSSPESIDSQLSDEAEQSEKSQRETFIATAAERRASSVDGESRGWILTYIQRKLYMKNSRTRELF